MAGNFQVTLALLKPDIASNPRILQSIEKYILSKKFYIVKRQQTRWNRDRAEQFYFQHKDKFFFERLVGFMSSGPISGIILAKENAVRDWRNLIGPTSVYQARFTHPKTIRGQIGLTDTRNTVHGSDTVKSAKMELRQVFPDFDMEEWEKNEQNWFEQGLVTYDKKHGIHEPIFDPSLKNYTHKDINVFDMSSPDAWSRFYSHKKELVDWFVDYNQLKSQIEELLSLNPSFKIIVDIGCGSSMLGPMIANTHSHLKVYCIDTNVECLQALARKCEGDNCTFAIGDVRKRLPFADKSVDLIIDKGTTDAVARNKDGFSYVKMVFNEVKRVLQPNGFLVQVTTDPPDIRIHMISSLVKGTNISFTKLPNSSNNMSVYTYRIRFSADEPDNPITNFARIPAKDEIIPL